MRTVAARFLAGLLLTTTAWVTQAAEIKLGVLANRGELEATTRWAGLAQYLSAELGQTVAIVPLPPARVLDAARTRQVDFVFSHSPHTVYVAEKLGGRVLATLNTPAGAHFGGVIIAKQGSGIVTAKDLKGKTVMSMKFKEAAGAYVFQTYHLKRQGIDPHRDFASLREGKKQDDLVLAVDNGLIDAAFIRTGLLETMEKEGKIKMDSFVIVDRQSGGEFPFVRSTELYPEWFLSALPGTPASVAAKLKAALIKLPADSPIAAKARMRGFIEPLPLDGLKTALKTLQIAPYGG